MFMKKVSKSQKVKFLALRPLLMLSAEGRHSFPLFSSGEIASLPNGDHSDVDILTAHASSRGINTEICATGHRSEYDQMHMIGILQRVIKACRIAIETITYELSWGEVDSVEDLMTDQEPNVPRAIG